MARAILNNDIIDVIYDKICGYPLEEAYKILDNHRNGAYIPTEWIKRYASNKSWDDEMDCYWHFWEEDVLKMIEDWEKENDRRKTD